MGLVCKWLLHWAECSSYTRIKYKHFGGLFRFFKNESARCGYIKETYRLSKNACNMHSRPCYLENGYEINNTYKVLEYNSNRRFPAPRRIPGTIPIEIEQQLIALKIEDSMALVYQPIFGIFSTKIKTRDDKND